MAENDDRNAYYMEQTILPAQLVSYYFHNFKVLIEKNPSPAIVNDYNPMDRTAVKSDRLLASSYWQEIADDDINADSWGAMAADDDEDIEMALQQVERESAVVVSSPGSKSRLGEDELKPDSLDNEQSETLLVSVDVQIRNTSMSIDNNECFLFNSEVRDAVVIPGNDETKGQDSLLISLSGDKIIILRMAVINGVMEPLIVLGYVIPFTSLGTGSVSSLYKLGTSVLAHRSGKVIAVSAFSKVVKFSMLDETGKKTKSPSTVDAKNLVLPGLIVSSCFLEPMEDQHVLYLSLVCTDNSILQMELTEIQIVDTSMQFIRHGAILLDNKFELPRFMVSLKHTTSVILIQETKCTLRGVSFLMSHEGADQAEIPLPRTHYNKPFLPEAYYVPQSFINAFNSEEYYDPDCKFDQVVLCANNTLWLLDVFYHYKQLKWSMKFRKLFGGMGHCISFNIEERDDDDDGDHDYTVNFAGDNGVNKVINLSRRKDGNGLSFTNMEDSSSKRTWIPTFGAEVTRTSSNKYSNQVSSERLWCIGRLEKSGALMNLRTGYTAKKSSVIPSFKRADKIFKYDHLGKLYFLVSFFHHSVLISFSEEQERAAGSLHEDDLEAVNEETVVENGIVYHDWFFENERTLLFDRLANGDFIHVLEKSWKIGSMDNLTEAQTFKAPEQWNITMASCYQNYVVIVSDKVCATSTADLSTEPRIAVDVFEVINDPSGNQTRLKMFTVSQDILIFQPSLVALFEHDKNLYLLMTSLNYEDVTTDDLLLFKFDGGSTFEPFSSHNLKEMGRPHDLSKVDGNSFQEDIDTYLIAHSIAIFPIRYLESPETRILITSKDGSYTVLRFGSELKYELTAKVAQGPLEIVETSHPDKFYLISKTIWKLDFTKSHMPERICVKEFTDRDCYSAVHIDSPFEEVTGRLLDDELLCIRNDGLTRLYVEQFTSPSIKQISLGSTPLKMMYMTSCDTFVVIVAEKEETHSAKKDGEGQGEGEGQGDTGSSSDDEVDVTTSKYELVQFYDQTTRKKLELFHNSNPKYDCFFKENEYPISLCEIIVDNEPYDGSSGDGLLDASPKRRFLAIGCSMLKDNKSIGRIKIFEFKRTKEYIRLRLVHSVITDSPVLAMNFLPNSAKLLFGSKHELRSISFTVDTLPELHEPRVEMIYASNVIGINRSKEDGTVVIVTESHSFYTYEGGDFKKPHQNDKGARFIMGNCLVQNGHVVVADKTYNSILIMNNKENSWEPTQVVSEVKVTFIPRLTECQFNPIWDFDNLKKRKKFIANGLNGEIKLYTSILGDEYRNIQGMADDLLRRPHYSAHNVPGNALRENFQWLSSSKENKNIINCDFLKSRAVYCDASLSRLMYSSVI